MFYHSLKRGKGSKSGDTSIKNRAVFDPAIKILIIAVYGVHMPNSLSSTMNNDIKYNTITTVVTISVFELNIPILLPA